MILGQKKVNTQSFCKRFDKISTNLEIKAVFAEVCVGGSVRQQLRAPWCVCVKLYLYSECEYSLVTRESAVVQPVKHVTGITGRAWLLREVRKQRRGRESEKEKERRESEKREVGGVCGGDCGVGGDGGGGEVCGARCAWESVEVLGVECVGMECVRQCGGTEKSKRASESDSEKAEGREREVGRDERGEESEL